MRVKFDQCDDALRGNVVWVKPGSDVKAKVGRRLFYEGKLNRGAAPVFIISTSPGRTQRWTEGSGALV